MKKNFRKVMSVFLAMAIMLCTMSVIASAASFKYVYDVMYDEFDEPYAVWITGYEGSAPSKLVIPESIEGLPVQSIEPMAFMGATSIKEVVIPETCFWIDDYAFAKCSNLEKITLPGSVFMIDEGAFFNCRKLSTVTYTGYEPDYMYMDIYNDNDVLWDADWIWTHYGDDIDYSYDVLTMTYKSSAYLEPARNLRNGEYVQWWSYDGYDYDDGCVFIYNDGEVYAYAKGTTTVNYEIVNRNGDVVFQGQCEITVKFSFIQWIINYLLFGWVWGF